MSRYLKGKSESHHAGPATLLFAITIAAFALVSACKPSISSHAALNALDASAESNTSLRLGGAADAGANVGNSPAGLFVMTSSPDLQKLVELTLVSEVTVELQKPSANAFQVALAPNTPKVRLTYQTSAGKLCKSADVALREGYLTVACQP